MKKIWWNGSEIIAAHSGSGMAMETPPAEFDGVADYPDVVVDAVGQSPSLYRVADGSVLEQRGADTVDPETGNLVETWIVVEIPAEVPPVPEVVTATQAKLTLLAAGLYEAIETYVQSAETDPDGVRYRIVWDAANWYRSSPELNGIAAEIGLTSERVDDLFRAAAAL